LKEDPGRRWQSAAELELQLAGVGAMGSRGRRVGVLIVAAVVLGLSAAAYFYFSRAPKLTDTDTIVLADFANSTGDTVFDGTLRQGLAVQLEQSPFLSVVPEDRVQQTLRMMKQPADAPMTPQVAREVCQRTASAAVLQGSISALGNQYVLGLRAETCRTEKSSMTNWCKSPRRKMC